MSGPEQAATVTPGQAAYGAWSKRFDGSMAEDWDKDLADSERRDWEAVAQAAIECKPGSERVAELVTEGNELRALVGTLTDAADYERKRVIDLTAMLSTLTDRAEASGAITGDEADEYRKRGGLEATP
jgi:hypothetical protein